MRNIEVVQKVIKPGKSDNIFDQLEKNQRLRSQKEGSNVDEEINQIEKELDDLHMSRVDEADESKEESKQDLEDDSAMARMRSRKRKLVKADSFQN